MAILMGLCNHHRCSETSSVYGRRDVYERGYSFSSLLIFEGLLLSVFCHCNAADIISTVEFNHDGEFLATGDKGGRVVIFQRDGTKVSLTCASGSICGVPYTGMLCSALKP